MRDHVTFLSDAFNLTEVRENFINPCCFGEDVAVWMIERLRAHPDLEVTPEPCQEDWGWEVFLSCRGRRFFIGIGQYEMDDGLGWLCFVESRLPFYMRWFGLMDDAEKQVVCDALGVALEGHGGITAIHWEQGAVRDR